MPAGVSDEALGPGPTGEPTTTPLPVAAVLDITAGSSTGVATEADLTTAVTPVAVPVAPSVPASPPAPGPSESPAAVPASGPTQPTGPTPGPTGVAVTPAVAPEGSGGDPAPGTGERRGAHPGTRRRWGWWIAGVVALVVVLAAATIAAAARINRPLAEPTLAPGIPASLLAAGTQPQLPWPATGQGAIAVPTLGYAAQSGPEASVPVASLTKMTTALVILRDHPVAPGASGPTVTVVAPDVAEYRYEDANDESNIPLQSGEGLTERQLLEAMLVRSANDAAFTLAVWDAGSVPAFVAKMNATAAQLGATSSHYVDASGYEPGSVSTAADCLRIAAADMAIPTFAQIVNMTSVDLPLVGTVPNIVSEIGTDGIIGVKSGYTSQAKAGLVLAADRAVGGRTVLVLAAVLTQPVPAAIVPPTATTTTTAASAHAPPTSTTTTSTIPADDLEVPDVFRYAGPTAQSLLAAAQAGVVQVPVATAGQSAGTVTARWGGHSYPAEVIAARSAWLAAWPGQRVSATARLVPVPPGSRSGRMVGEATFALGDQIETVPLRLATTVAEPSWWWRLVHD